MSIAKKSSFSPLGILFLVGFLGFFGCTEKETAAPEPVCNTFATVKDLRGLDGCGFVLQLDNGQRLRPHYPPMGCFGPMDSGSEKYPILKFALKDGQRVQIGYIDRQDEPNTCMTGNLVHITCITALDITECWPMPVNAAIPAK